MRGVVNVFRDEYPDMATSALGILIFIEGYIRGNQKSSTYENCGGRGIFQHKERMGHTFIKHRLGTEDNATLVVVKDGTTFNYMF